MNHSDELFAKIALARGLHRTHAVLTQPLFDAFLPEYLFCTHCVARASVPLMEAALERARRIAPDGVAAGIIPYLEEHIVEEKQHAQWLLTDLSALGVSGEAVIARIPPPSVAALVGAQYYWIAVDHPVAVLAYMSVLEGGMPPASVIESLVQASRHPQQAFDTLLKHCQVDVEHSARIRNLLDELPLTGRDRALLGVSASHTVEAMSVLLNEAVHRTRLAAVDSPPD